MTFPFEIIVNNQAAGAAQNSTLKIHGGITVLLGPNGSGKTQLMRATKQGLQQIINQQGPNGAPPTNKKGQVYLCRAHRSA